MSRGGTLTPGTGFSSISTQRVSMVDTPNPRLGGAFARRFSESEPNRSYEIILYHGVVRYSDLITSADDQVLPWGEYEAPQNKLRRYQNLVQTCMRSVRPKFVIDLNCRPKIFPDVVLKSRIP